MGSILANVPLLTAALLGVVALLLFGPALIRSAERDGSTIALTGIYVMGVAPVIQHLVDPTLLSANAARVSQAGSLLIYILAALAVIGSIRAGRRPRAPVIALGLYALILIISGIANGGLTHVLLILPLAAFIVSRGTGLTAPRVIRHLRYITRILTLVSLWLAASSYTAVDFTDNNRTLFGLTQLAGATPHPNVLGPVAALAVLFELAPADKGRALGRLVGLVAAVTCCLLAQSHAGWVMVAAGGVLLLYGRRPRRPRVVRRRSLLPLLYWLVWAGALFLGWRSVTATPGEPLIPRNDYLDGRQNVWSIVLQPFAEHPWLGGGPGVFSDEFRANNGDLGTLIGQAHNQVLQTLASAGMLGGLVLVFIAVSWAVTAGRQWRAGVSLPAAVGVALLVYGGVESPLRGALDTATFMVLAAFMLLLARVDSRAVGEADVTRTLSKTVLARGTGQLRSGTRV